jgi:transposase
MLYAIIIRQESLFDMLVLFDLEPTHEFNAILPGIDILLNDVMRKSQLGLKQSLINYSTMIYSLIIRITERIPSEAPYSRMITLISQSDALEIVQERLLLQAISEGFV